jgi:hypothetical protein
MLDLYRGWWHHKEKSESPQSQYFAGFLFSLLTNSLTVLKIILLGLMAPQNDSTDPAQSMTCGIFVLWC